MAGTIDLDAYRPGVGLMLINRDRQIFVAKRIDMPSDAWQMPQGGIDDGETPEQAALRELEEETGTAKARILRVAQEWVHYDLPEELRAKLWKGRFRGQRQLWFALAFTGRDSDINLETEHPEFSDWKWAPPRDVPDLIVGFKRDLYRQVLAEFADLLV